MSTSSDVRPRSRWKPVSGKDRQRMREEAARDYEAGSSVRAVAAHLAERWGHCSFGLAWDLLHEARVPMRSKTAGLRRRPPADRG